MKRERLNVGLLVSDADNDFDRKIVAGAMKGAREADANLIIFPGRYIKPVYHDKVRTRTDYQYNTVFSYVDKNHIDVLLVTLGTICTTMTESERRIFLDMYHDIPVTLIASDLDGYSSVNFDNRTGLRDGIIDLISKGRKHICMVSGPMTNQDAIERLNVYKDTLTEYGIDFTDDQIVYGNFSEYCTDEMEILLKKNPNVDAIVFANDSMAIGGYKVLKEHDFNIGKDVLVFGFDDSPVTTTLMPNLSSVMADAKEMGRIAVIKSAENFKNESAVKTIIDTNYIKRESTGNDEGSLVEQLIQAGICSLIRSDKNSASEMILSKFYGAGNALDVENDEFRKEFLGYCQKAISKLLELVETKRNDYENVEKVGFLLRKLMNCEFAKSLDITYVLQVVDILRPIIKSTYPDKIELIDELLYFYVTQITLNVYSKKHADDEFMQEVFWMSNSIARDMVQFDDDEDEGFATVTDKLIRLGFKSAYLYTYDAPYLNSSEDVWHDWKIADKMYLKSFYDDTFSEIVTVPKDRQEILSTSIYDNEYMPQGRQFCATINVCFINEEQLGILVCEAGMKQMPYMTSIIAQLSSALKIIYMMKYQSNIKKQLQISLQKIKESNNMLETISKTDELTGIYNRRGFFEMANNLIHNKRNAGKKAILVFADMDNLKIVNDKFGHDDGDFSLRAVADILRESMRTSDIVSRIGGDEFACIAITEQEADAAKICLRIKKICDRFNENSEKPYYLGISVGYSEFECDENAQIEKYMEMADDKLYEDKKNKRKNIIK